MTSSTTTMTLTDFLLARIAEDEEAQRPHPGYGHTLGQSWHQFECDLVASEGHRDCDCPIPARVLAECEAKRRIVEMIAPHADDWRDFDTMLRALALPYADHPDYREEWGL